MKLDRFRQKKFILTLIILVLIILGVGWKVLSSKNQQPQYQTAQAQKGTLVKTVTASGDITAINTVNITTTATGVVSNVYIKNGDEVSAGDKIADLSLDQASQQKQAAAWASYLQAKTQLDAASANLDTLQNTEFTANQKLINDAVARGLTTNDPTYIEENASWLAAEANYKNQQAVINQAQASVSSAWLSYQQISSVITAPASGVITDLTITPGYPITSTQTSSSTTSTSAQTLGTITLPQGGLDATVNLSEVDAPQVKVGDKVTITLDAFSDKTFAGRVLSINTNGVVSSGVTTYPATISLETSLGNIYPNMAVNSTIITKVKGNALLVPSQAIQTQNGESQVRVLRNNQPQTVTITVGDSNDTQTEVTSGLTEGDLVVTGTTGGATSTSSSISSPFSGRGFGGFGGGGAFRGGGRGG